MKQLPIYILDSENKRIIDIGPGLPGETAIDVFLRYKRFYKPLLQNRLSWTQSKEHLMREGFK